MTDIKKLESKGFKRWQKNGMDRMYISYDILDAWCIANEGTLDSADMVRLYGYMNRYERQNGKIWIEVTTGEIKTKGISNEKEVKAIVEMFIAA